MNVEVSPAVPADIDELVPHVRQADIDEFLACSGQSPREVIEDGLKHSRVAWTGRIDGEVVCIFGVVGYSLLSNRGAPWLVGSDRMEGGSKAFLRRCRKYAIKMLREYPELANYVDARNATAIRWLKWLGFEFDEPEPYGVAGLPFHRFSMRVG
ncbi:phage protein Gp13 family protein [Alcanivorax jadensis]|uniref:phage protein Gp13 family protein n=1 Tax=Alcanivorax jadensis TaxID=64988 RepID=UPI00235559A0|nr:phage protein Gp13 family protein [Alcanivorax jadensis]